MKKSFFKIIFREIKERKGSFLIIIAIVTLGVAFLTGLLSTPPNLKKTIDSYFDSNNVADLIIKSPNLLTDDDLNMIKNLGGVENVMPLITNDKTIQINNELLMARFQYANRSINQLDIIEGRDIENNNECLVEQQGEYFKKIPIGTYINDGYNDYLVVGIVKNPWYFSNEKEITNSGIGRVQTIIYANNINNSYSECFVTLHDAKAMDTFSNKYKEYVTGIKNEVQSLNKDFLILDRQSNISIISYELNVNKVSDVVKIFPVFFFLIAALVALTTMTRRVEEERITIGTLKALGYSNSVIILKYLVFALLASAVGAVIGVLAGFILFPAIVSNAFSSTYYFPKLIISYDLKYTTISSLVAILSIVISTVFSTLHTLREKPSTLMQQKAPIIGKRVLLEKIPFIWKRLKFKYKSTIRNVFRQKKHLFMTIIGIAGCTGLILTGFGLYDSIGVIVKNQYEDIIKYDLVLRINDPDDNFLKIDEINSYIGLNYSNQTIIKNKQQINANLCIFNNIENINNYIGFINLQGKKIEFNKNDVFVTEQIAKQLNLKVGEIIEISNQNFTITQIVKNYIDNYVYCYQEHSETNTYFANINITGIEAEDQLSEILLASGKVTSIDFLTQTRNTYNNLLSTITYVIIVIIISAISLAIIVIYNLILVNISERKKEIATLKVLGYNQREVCGYVYRETTLLTILGIVVGILIGVLIHLFIITTIESDGMMFGRSIKWYSYLLSIIIIFGCSWIINLIMYFKIRSIKMVDSLKATE